MVETGADSGFSETAEQVLEDYLNRLRLVETGGISLGADLNPDYPPYVDLPPFKYRNSNSLSRRRSSESNGSNTNQKSDLELLSRHNLLECKVSRLLFDPKILSSDTGVLRTALAKRVVCGDVHPDHALNLFFHWDFAKRNFQGDLLLNDYDSSVDYSLVGANIS